jgi:putative two-component system response regulator
METAFYAGTDIRKIIESLPKEEAEHMRRVGILVGILTQKLYGYDTCQEHKYFGAAASYHDIGKAWVPKSILMKPDRLTEQERAIVFQHPVFAKKLFDQAGEDLIPGIPRHFFHLVIDAAIYHHEWWNGNGYPYGIGYDDIPSVARITSICDAYDAMTSDRMYRVAHTHYYACRQLEKNAGTQFDPAFVQAFLDNAQEISVLANKMISCL